MELAENLILYFCHQLDIKLDFIPFNLLSGRINVKILIISA
ncbi:hypothetical protein D1AOALGA4SA_13149 [Olavius algarvensis Delta 1 endosymbiont]|nr:hypothetical protein D1AOALGA4SA_13149 [Olavius algarvensis Delta 1 endosymbiont]